MSEAKQLPVQFGEADSADFEHMTWTFHMGETFSVGAGQFAIVPHETYTGLLQALQLLHDDIAEYGRINNLGGYDNHVMRLARAAIAKAEGRS